MNSTKIAVFILAFLVLGGALIYSLTNVQPQGEKLVLYDSFGYYEQNMKIGGDSAQFILPDGVERDSVNLRIVNGYVISQFINEANRTNGDDLLKSYVGKQVSVFDDKGKEINGMLLKFDGKAYVKAGSDLFVITPSYYQLPGFNGNITDQNASVMFRINATQNDAKLTYLMDSISWKPDYTLYLAGDRGTLSLYGAVSNNAQDYGNISLSLFYGQIKRTNRGYYYPAYDYAKGMGNSFNSMESAPSAAPSYTPQAVSEFYKFDLGNTALPKGESKFNLFDKGITTVKKTYEMSVGSYSSDPSPLAIVLSINNSAANGLGVALPAGNVRIMDESGFVGEDTASDTTKGEELKLSPGSAFDVVGTSKLVNQTSDIPVNCAPGIMAASDSALCIGEKGYINMATYTYEANVKNKKDTSASVVLNYNPYGDWSITDESMPHEKVSQNLVRWKFTLGSNSEQTVRFTIRVKTGRTSPPIYYGGGVAVSQ